MNWINFNKVDISMPIYGIQQGARQYISKNMKLVEKNEEYAVIYHCFGDYELVNNKTLFLVKTPR